MDEYWKSALLATLDLVPFVDIVYTPKAFFPYSRKFYPLEYSENYNHLTVGFCVQKDLLHRLAPNLLEAIDSPAQVIFSNDVFIVGCLTPTPNINWFYYSENRYHEFVMLREYALTNVMGRNTTRYWRIDKGTGEHKVLIVGASNMGNIGDDLIAMAIGGLLCETQTGCSLYFTDFQVTRADLIDFDLVIVGGGGIIYSSQFGMNDTDNLSNYMKIFYWANHLSIPCILMGVGVQGRTGHLAKDPIVCDYLKQSLPLASAVLVRDQLSLNELKAISETKIELLPDLVFSYANNFPYYKSMFDRGCKRAVAFIGEIFSERLSFFNYLFKSPTEEIYRIFATTEIKYCIMSNDDLSHKDRFVDLMKSKGIECIVHDLRNCSIVELLDFFRSLSGIITTRFHGLVLSIISGCPALSIDLSYGKHALLIKDYFPSINDNLISEMSSNDLIISKLVALSEQPTCLLAKVEEIEAVRTATKGYLDIVKNLLAKATNSDQVNPVV